jgi:hypothetical protein
LASQCSGLHGECTRAFDVVLRETAQHAYDFVAYMNGAELQFRIESDWLAGVSGSVQGAFQILSGLPALIGILVSFRKDLANMLRALFGREKPANE